jgi:hypothetical protein
MKIPNLEEVIINTTDHDELIDLMKKSKVGALPVYSDLSQLGLERLLEVLSVIEDVLYELNISPQFPYPYYIITPFDGFKTIFPLVSSAKYLPRYYVNPTQRVTNKEQRLLDKIEILCAQIKNQNIQQRLEEYKVSIMPQKFIKHLAKESAFLERILNKLDGEQRE